MACGRRGRNLVWTCLTPAVCSLDSGMGATAPPPVMASRATRAASRPIAGPAAKVRTIGQGACTAQPRIQPQRLQGLVDPTGSRTEPLAVKANTGFRGCPAVATPLVVATKFAAPGNTNVCCASAESGSRSSRTSRTRRESMLIGTGRPAPAEDGDPGLRVAGLLLPPDAGHRIGRCVNEIQLARRVVVDIEHVDDRDVDQLVRGDQGRRGRALRSSRCATGPRRSW